MLPVVAGRPSVEATLVNDCMNVLKSGFHVKLLPKPPSPPVIGDTGTPLLFNDAPVVCNAGNGLDTPAGLLTTTHKFPITRAQCVPGSCGRTAGGGYGRRRVNG
jgi:hypothetical protein